MKLPPESVTVDIITRSTPFEGCSAKTMAPAMGCFDTLSTTVPLIALPFTDTSPACNVGLRRAPPLPCMTMDAQVLKSILMSVCASLDRFSSTAGPLATVTQLKPVGQLLGEGAGPVELLSSRNRRIC